MPVSGTLVSSRARRRWPYISAGLGLILVAIALTVGWQFLGFPDPLAAARGSSTVRWLVYLLGTILFLLLIAGLGLLVILLLREVQLNERQSNFISAVTHELKTPVASLRLYLDTLQLRDVTDERREAFYRTMGQDLERLNATINSVLNAAMYSDRAPIEQEPLDFSKLVHRSIELTRSRHQLGVEAIRYAGPESLTVSGDAGALETAVLNLLDNAVKYSRDEVSVDVTLDLDERGATRLRVHDDGIGMSRGDLRFIFNRFYRIGAEVRRRRTGTGLGLFIVHTVVKKHGGKVVGESGGPDRGSTFTLTLPQQRGAAA